MTRRRVPTEAAFDLAFVRDLKHRLRMALRELEKAEKWLKKADQFERHATPTPERVNASLAFYKSLELRSVKEQP